MERLTTNPGLFEQFGLDPTPSYVVLGVPFETTTSFRPGTRYGPEAIRRASKQVETYSLQHNLELSDHTTLKDLGDIPTTTSFEQLRKDLANMPKLLPPRCVPILLGGEHTITYPAFKTLLEKNKLGKDPLFIQLDAHMDLRNQYLDSRYSHATVTRRIAEIISPERIIQIGVRTGSQEEHTFAKANGIHQITAPHLIKNWEKAKLEIRDALSTTNSAYTSLDIDVLDPAIAPGTGTPEPGGLNYHQVATLIEEELAPLTLAFDLVEVSPPLDNGVTSIVAANLVYRFIIGRIISKSKKS